MDPYYIYVTLHLLERRSESFAKLPCATKWRVATDAYEKFLHNEYDIPDVSQYDCIENFLSNVTIEL